MQQFSDSLHLLTYKDLLDRDKILRQPFIRWPSFLADNDLYRERKVSPKYQNQVVLLYSILPKVALDPEQKQEASQSQYTRFDSDIRPVDIKDCIRSKQNQNVGIFGSSGGGKSRLFRHLLNLFSDKTRIVLSPKPNDEALKAGIPVIDARSAIQSPWKDPDAFAQSFVVALHQKIRAGIQLQPIRTFLKEICQETNEAKDPSWQSFRDVLQQKKKQVTKNQQETLSNIEINLPQVIIETPETPVEVGNRKSVVLDFSKIADSDARTLWLEFFLRGCWNRIQNETLKDVIICVDEGHLISKQEYSIIHEMSKEIRHRGSLWIVTQGLFELRPETAQNLATKFCFKTGTEDLDISRKINEILRHTLSQLSSYEFIDLEWPRFSEYVPVFKFVKAEDEDKPTQLIDTTPKLPAKRNGSKGEGDGGAAEGEEEKKPKLAIGEEEIVKLLPAWQRDIVKKIGERHKELSYKEVKLAVWDALKRIANSGRAGMIRLEEGEEQTAFLYCYLRGRNISQLHSYIQQKTRDVIGRIYRIDHYAASGEFSNADIETSTIDFEIETGLGNKTTNLEKRLAATLKAKSGKSVIIVVPNEETGAKYTKHLLTYIKSYPDRLSIMTLRELKTSIRDLQNRGHGHANTGKSGQEDTEKVGQDGEHKNA